MDWFENAARYLVQSLENKKFVVGETFLREYLEKETTVLDSMDDEEKDISINDWLESFEQYLRNNFSNDIYVGKNFRWMKGSEKPIQNTTSSQGVSAENKQQAHDHTSIKPELVAVQTEKPLELLHKLFESGNFSECIIRGHEILETLRREAASADEKLSVLGMMIEAAKTSKRVDLYKLYLKQGEIFAKDEQHEDAANSYESAIDLLIKHYKDGENAIPKTKEKINELFRKCRVQFESGLAVDEASRVFVKECRFNKSIENNLIKKILMFMFDLTSEYGECPRKVFCSGVFIIFFWAVFYFFAGINAPSSELALSCSHGQPTVIVDCIEVTENMEIGAWGPVPWSSFPSHLYYSAVTFTTLGYGDFSPQEGVSRFLSAVEAVLGLIFTSLFLAAFIKKYSR